MLERPKVLHIDGTQLVAIVHLPVVVRSRRAVVIVVGGPQYRVGSHRQFVLLARELASQGIPVLRFDHSGMGDSDGATAGFEQLDMQIRVAVDALLRDSPGVSEVTLWGLCDGASASLMYAHTDPRVTRLVLVNPWVRTKEGLAQSYLTSYYGRRVLSRDFWRKATTDPSTVIAAGWDFLRKVLLAIKAQPSLVLPDTESDADFVSRMLRGSQLFRGKTLLLLSGNDLVATEFKLLLQRDRTWAATFGRPQVAVEELADANHTFASAEHRRWVAHRTLGFVLSD